MTKKYEDNFFLEFFNENNYRTLQEIDKDGDGYEEMLGN
jgi:hypothetical protein